MLQLLSLMEKEEQLNKDIQVYFLQVKLEGYVSY